MMLDFHRVLAIGPHSAGSLLKERAKISDQLFSYLVEINRDFLQIKVNLRDRKPIGGSFESMRTHLHELSDLFRKPVFGQSQYNLIDFSCSLSDDARDFAVSSDQIIKGNVTSYNQFVDRYNHLLDLIQPFLKLTGKQFPPKIDKIMVH